MAKQQKDVVTVEAELTLVSSEGTEIVRTFDKAWHRALELPIPVSVSFNKFVRKDAREAVVYD